MVAIKSALPPGADVDTMFAEIEQAADWYHLPMYGGLTYQRDMLRRHLKHIDDLITGPWVEPYMANALSRLRERIERRLTLYDAVAAHWRGHGLRRELLYGELLRIWVEHGGSPGVSHYMETGGRCARFMITAVHAITDTTLGIRGVEAIVRRWRKRSVGKFRGTRLASAKK
jgi:hypothetical protein